MAQLPLPSLKVPTARKGIMTGNIKRRISNDEMIV